MGEVAAGELPRLAALRRHDEDVRPSIVSESLAVVFVLQRGDHASRSRLPAFLLVFRFFPTTDLRREREARAVRRPPGAPQAVDAIREVRDPRALAAVGEHDIELGFLLRVAVRDERQARTIR